MPDSCRVATSQTHDTGCSACVDIANKACRQLLAVWLHKAVCLTVDSKPRSRGLHCTAALVLQGTVHHDK